MPSCGMTLITGKELILQDEIYCVENVFSSGVRNHDYTHIGYCGYANI